MKSLRKSEQRGRIDEVKDLETLDLVAFNDGVNPWDDAFVTGGFGLGRKFFRDTIARWGFAGLGAVADIACGYGRWSMFLAEANAAVSGYDQNVSGVALAQKLATLLHLPNARFCVSDIADTTAEAASFDGVWCFNVMSYVDRAATLGEAHRILKPHGRLFVGHYLTTGSMLEIFTQWYPRQGLSGPKTRFALEGLLKGPDFDGRGNFASVPDLKRIFARHGFEVTDSPEMYVHRSRGGTSPYADLLENHPAEFALRLSQDDDFAREFVQCPDALAGTPMHVGLVAMRI